MQRNGQQKTTRFLANEWHSDIYSNIFVIITFEDLTTDYFYTFTLIFFFHQWIIYIYP